MADTNKRELETEPAEEAQQQPAAKRQRPDEEPAAAATDNVDAPEGMADAAPAPDEDMEGEEPTSAGEEAAAEDDSEAQEVAAAAKGKKYEPFKLGYRTFNSPLEASAYIRRILSAVRQDQPLNEVRGCVCAAVMGPLGSHALCSSGMLAQQGLPQPCGSTTRTHAGHLHPAMAKAAGLPLPEQPIPPCLQPPATRAWPQCMGVLAAAADHVHMLCGVAAV
jgi:hypothetical protein